MTSKSTHLGLSLYAFPTDGTRSTYSYYTDIAGTSASSNMKIIDTFAGQTSASNITTTASIVAISASLVTMSASLVHMGTVAQINAGTSNSLSVSASSLAVSNFGRKTCFLPLNGAIPLTGDEYQYVRIPSEMNGWYLKSVAACCHGASSSGAPTFQVVRYHVNSSSGTNMLSTALSIDAGEMDSSTAATAAVISSSASAVATGDQIGATVTATGTGVTWAGVSVTFQQYVV